MVSVQISCSDEDEDERNELKSQSTNESSKDKMADVCIIHDLAQWLKPTFEEIS